MEIEFEDIHLAILAVTALLILYADHEGFSYLRGTRELLSLKKTKSLHYGVWAGLVGMIATGIVLFWPERAYFVSEPEFLIKMCMVFALVVNAVLIGTLSKISATIPFAQLPQKTKRLLFISGGVSTLGWVGAAIVGFFFL